jgi:hypothetical protein
LKLAFFGPASGLWKIWGFRSHIVGQRMSGVTVEVFMQRRTSGILSILLLIGSVCYGQSLGDAARKVRKQQGKNGSSPTKVFTNDDVSVNPDTIVRLVPGENFSGQRNLIAPGDGNTSTDLSGWMQADL